MLVLPYIVSQNTPKLYALCEQHNKCTIPGLDGENVTIMVLMLNRVHFTIRLLDSLLQQIPNFAGSILIFDNASNASAKHELQQYLAAYKFTVQTVWSEQNLGVGNARNKAAEYIKTAWFLSLDNDIYFTQNIFPHLQHAYTQTGAHFINAALLDSDGKAVFSMGGLLEVAITNKGLRAECIQPQRTGKVSDKNPPPLYLGDFLLGGAGLYNTRSFIELGGFDKRFFIGLEDVEFSLRVGLAGRKIVNCTKLCLVHDHSSSQSTEDISYEALRHSNKHVENSMRCLEQDYGLSLPRAETNHFLLLRQYKMGALTKKAKQPGEASQVFLVVDTPHRALDQIAQAIVKEPQSDLIYTIIYTSDYLNIVDLILACSAADLVHFLYRFDLYFALRERKHPNAITAALEGIDYNQLISNFLATKILTTNIADEYHIHHAADAHLPFTGLFQQYSVINQRLQTIYVSKLKHPPMALIYDGVVLPKQPQPIKNQIPKTIKIGWVSNSNNASWFAGRYPGESTYQDLEGMQRILLPAFKRLQEEGFAVELVRQDSAVRHPTMEEFYNSIDIYVSTSNAEGNPLTVMEAMAYGLPIVSTNVGVVPELFGPKQQQYMPPAYEAEQFYSTLKKLITNPEEWADLRAENLQRITRWERSKTVAPYHDFFRNCLSDPSNAVNTQARLEFFAQYARVPAYFIGIFTIINRVAFLKQALRFLYRFAKKLKSKLA